MKRHSLVKRIRIGKRPRTGGHWAGWGHGTEGGRDADIWLETLLSRGRAGAEICENLHLLKFLQ